MKPGLLIDRDGLLNLPANGVRQLTPLSLEEFRINSTLLRPLQRLKAAGFVVVATSNQPELSRGNLSRRELDRMHDALQGTLPIDDILVCPHEESDHCPCRKPRPGLLHEAAFKWHLALGQSYVVSAKWQDAEAARMVGCTSLMIASPWLGKVHHDFVVPDILAACDKLFEVLKLQEKVA